VIRYRVVFVGEGELPPPDDVFRHEALTPGELTLYRAERWLVTKITTVDGVDARVVVLRRRLHG
jgi:hypothetical protein